MQVERVVRNGARLAARLESGEAQLALATDGSPVALAAAEVAGHLARDLALPLTLLVALHESLGFDEGQTAINRVIGAVGAVEPPARAEPLIGYAGETLIGRLEVEPVDLLVTGAFRHHSETDPFALGITAQRLVRSAPCSVLAVKGPTLRIRSLLVCAGLGDDPTVAVGIALAARLGARLRLLHVVPESAAEYLGVEGGTIPLDALLDNGSAMAHFMGRTLAALRHAGFDRDTISLRRGDAASELLLDARAHRDDVIVLGRHMHPGRFVGSTAEQVLRHAHRSVLLVHTEGS